MEEILAALTGSDLITNVETGKDELWVNGYGIAAIVLLIALGIGGGILFA